MEQTEVQTQGAATPPDQAPVSEAVLKEQPKEQIIDVMGGGHIVLADGRGVPGNFANCRLTVDIDTLKVVRIEPLGGAPPAPPPEVSAGEAVVQAGDTQEAMLQPTMPESEVQP